MMVLPARADAALGRVLVGGLIRFGRGGEGRGGKGDLQHKIAFDDVHDELHEDPQDAETDEHAGYSRDDPVNFSIIACPAEEEEADDEDHRGDGS